jgi:hypothetical protein
VSTFRSWLVRGEKCKSGGEKESWGVGRENFVTKEAFAVELVW